MVGGNAQAALTARQFDKKLELRGMFMYICISFILIDFVVMFNG